MSGERHRLLYYWFLQDKEANRIPEQTAKKLKDECLNEIKNMLYGCQTVKGKNDG